VIGPRCWRCSPVLARRFVRVTGRELLLYWARRFELGNLKAIIRGKVTDQPRQQDP